MIKFCYICGKNPRYGKTRYCKECINRMKREKYHNNPEYRLKCMDLAKKNRKKRYHNDKDFKRKIKEKNKRYYDAGYYNSPSMNINRIKFWMKKISDENFKKILKDIDIKIKEKK